jgi:hypothetical protein
MFLGAGAVGKSIIYDFFRLGKIIDEYGTNPPSLSLLYRPSYG